VKVETLRVPTVPLISSAFEGAVRSNAYTRGLPMRFVFLPHPVAYLPLEECKKKVRAADPVTGVPILEEIAYVLTRPLSEEERREVTVERPVSRKLGPATAEELVEMFHEKGWTDGLPIVLPTEERVSEMLKGTTHSAHEIVGKMSPAPTHEAWSYTVEKVAVNAVMAGAKPEYFPVILAIASAGISALFSSTNSFASMVVINGPIRSQIGMNSGMGAFGPFNRANATIGRCWTLVSKNLGNGGVLGYTYMGSQGNSLNFNNLCVAENEEALPEGWLPFHVQKGFKRQESVVSLFHGWSWSNIGGFEEDKEETIKRFLTRQTGCCGATIALDPLVAKKLKDRGFGSKERLIDWLKEHVMTPKEEYWGIPGLFVEPHPEEKRLGEQGIEPYASWLRLPEGAVVPVPRAKVSVRGYEINVLVTGGGTNPYWQGGSLRYLGSASIDEWR
jgi:hypothetical protein